MRILVFGGHGFLGTRLLPMLQAAGHTVIAPRSREFDLTAPPSNTSALGEPDVLIHAAALYGGMPFDMENQAKVFSTNMSINVHAFEIAQKIGVRKIVTIGSACAYPGISIHNFSESDLFTGPLHPSVECHGFTKLALVAAHRAYYGSFELEGVHLLPANLYGPGDVFQERRAHVVAALMKKFTDAVDTGADVQLLGDGSPIREFMYIDDLSRATVRAAELDIPAVTLINVGTGIGHTIRELAEMIAELTGFRACIQWSDASSNGAPRKVMRVDRMRTILGLDSTTPLREGLQLTLAWYRRQKSWADARW